MSFVVCHFNNCFTGCDGNVFCSNIVVWYVLLRKLERARGPPVHDVVVVAAPETMV